MTMQTVSLNRAYGGMQGVYRHASARPKTDMTFSSMSRLTPDGAKRRCLVSLRTDLHACQRDRKRRIPAALAPSLD